MMQSYDKKPKETWLEVLHEIPGGSCIIHFNEGITEVHETDPDGNEVLTYTADHHAMEAVYRSGLEKSIKENREAWLAAAVEAEQTGKPKTEIEVLQEGMKKLREANADIENAVNDLTIAVLEGGI